MAIKTLREGAGGPGQMKAKLIEILDAQRWNMETLLREHLEAVRCENCQHWSKGDGYPGGACAWLSESGSQQAYCDAVVSTAPDFFCAKFEERG
jgi:hypothetical protein